MFWRRFLNYLLRLWRSNLMFLIIIIRLYLLVLQRSFIFYNIFIKCDLLLCINGHFFVVTALKIKHIKPFITLILLVLPLAHHIRRRNRNNRRFPVDIFVRCKSFKELFISSHFLYLHLFILLLFLVSLGFTFQFCYLLLTFVLNH